MYRKILFIVLLSVATGFCVSAQKVVGDITPLKGEELINVVLDFSETLVNGKAEQAFVDAEVKKAKTENDKEKWLTEWNENLRRDGYNTMVLTLNACVGERYFLVGDYEAADYTIVVKVKDITVGQFSPVGYGAKNSAIKADVSFVKTGETTSFATVEFKKPSSSSTSSITPPLIPRIALSFGELGADIGEALLGKLK